MRIRCSTEADLNEISKIHLAAFGQEEGPEIAELVNALLEDATAEPLLSLVAESGGSLAGHILFTSANLLPGGEPSIQILAPLAVFPGFQNAGVGGALIRDGLDRLAKSGVDLVFVLGHPGYYPKYGFQRAGVLGFAAPHPILPRNADAWMVQELGGGAIDKFGGTVNCSDVLNQPQYWQE